MVYVSSRRNQRCDSAANKYAAFLRKVALLEEEKREAVAKGKESEANILDEAADDASSKEQKRLLEIAARSKRLAAKEWRRGMGLSKDD